jgi:pSer/pThr/pTyr-binding forkhead associated (FHA) protein
VRPPRHEVEAPIPAAQPLPKFEPSVEAKPAVKQQARPSPTREPEVLADGRREESSVPCERCGGTCAAGEVFCKFCGAPLAPSAERAERAVVAEGLPPRRESERGQREETAEAAILRDQARPRAPELELPARQAEPRGQRVTPRGGAGTEAEASTGRLVVIVEDGSEGTAIDLRGRQVDVGSTEGDIVLPEDRYLGARHARLFRQDNHWYLRDLGSLNGVYRRLRKPAALKNGDLVLLGLEVLQFQTVDHAEQGLGHAVQHGVLLFGSPATQRRARLCQRTVEGVARDVYHLVGNETTIGREIGDIVFTSDPFMSRRHATLNWDESTQGYVLSDLNSSNGTYLAIREDVRLEHGDFIRLGQHLFRVDLLAPPAGAGNAGSRGAGRGGG